MADKVEKGASSSKPDTAVAAAVVALEEAYGPGIFVSAAHNKIPEDAWEFHIRKSLQDAAYNTLEYVPYCSTTPVQQSCDEPKFMWKKKERH